MCPMITPGMPEKVKPLTSNGQSSPTERQCRPIWYQMLGICGPRWGSLASRGFPDAVSLPDTTQAFDPMPLPRGPRTPSRELAASATLFTAAAMPAFSSRPALCGTVASGSAGTLGSQRLKSYSGKSLATVSAGRLADSIACLAW